MKQNGRSTNSYFIFILIGMVFLLFRKKSRWYEKINVYAMFGFLFLGIFIGGANIFYYSIPLMVFTCLGLAGIGEFVDIVIKKAKFSKRNGVVIAVSCVLCLMGAYTFSMNTDYMKIDKEDHFLYQFKEIVQQEENPTLLNVNMLDAGLYTVAGIVPSQKYFQTNGIAFEEMFQERYIREGVTQFVICRFYYPEYITEKYELAAEASFATDGKNENSYYLFKRKE